MNSESLRDRIIKRYKGNKQFTSTLEKFVEDEETGEYKEDIIEKFNDNKNDNDNDKGYIYTIYSFIKKKLGL